MVVAGEGGGDGDLARCGSDGDLTRCGIDGCQLLVAGRIADRQVVGVLELWLNEIGRFSLNGKFLNGEGESCLLLGFGGDGDAIAGFGRFEGFVAGEGGGDDDLARSGSDGDLPRGSIDGCEQLVAGGIGDGQVVGILEFRLNEIGGFGLGGEVLLNIGECGILTWVGLFRLHVEDNIFLCVAVAGKALARVGGVVLQPAVGGGKVGGDDALVGDGPGEPLSVGNGVGGEGVARVPADVVVAIEQVPAVVGCTLQP